MGSLVSVRKKVDDAGPQGLTLVSLCLMTEGKREDEHKPWSTWLRWVGSTFTPTLGYRNLDHRDPNTGQSGKKWILVSHNIKTNKIYKDSIFYIAF